MKTAIKYFKQVKSSSLEGRTILLIARLCYLWGFYSEGLSFLEPIFETYYELKIVDDHFLFMRGIPDFGEAFANKAVFAKLINKPKLIIDELEKAKTELQDYPFLILEENLSAFLTGDWVKVIKTIDKDEQSLGFNPTLKALIESRLADAFESATTILENVKLTENDFHWLQDILLLGKAEAASRFNRKAEEKKYQDAFLKRQPMLFEPNHVFNFGLDEYQEKLKLIYKDKIRTLNS